MQLIPPSKAFDAYPMGHDDAWAMPIHDSFLPTFFFIPVGDPYAGLQYNSVSLAIELAASDKVPLLMCSPMDR
jgi:hypothetical protein